MSCHDAPEVSRQRQVAGARPGTGHRIARLAAPFNRMMAIVPRCPHLEAGARLQALGGGALVAGVTGARFVANRLCLAGGRSAIVRLSSRESRRDGRVAEGARLESVYTGNRIVGSNPTPSASAPSHSVNQATAADQH
jgi:hypothetical protein